MGNFYQIGEVCQVTGLTPRTLHYYDEIGLLVPSERLAGGQRLYTASDLERIEEIKELKRLLGLSLSEVKRLLDAEDARRRHMAAASEAPDEPARRAALEQALGVAEAQARSVQAKIHQLTEFGRKLERHVRDLRRLLRNGNGAAVRQEAAKAAGGPAKTGQEAAKAAGGGASSDRREAAAKTGLKAVSAAGGPAANRAGGER